LILLFKQKRKEEKLESKRFKRLLNPINLGSRKSTGLSFRASELFCEKALRQRHVLITLETSCFPVFFVIQNNLHCFNHKIFVFAKYLFEAFAENLKKNDLFPKQNDFFDTQH
jgi:hypothetical protein